MRAILAVLCLLCVLTTAMDEYQKCLFVTALCTKKCGHMPENSNSRFQKWKKCQKACVSKQKMSCGF
ncbi:hypothetical protein Q1695_014125 [Nippostrongylus brasiliensis]|nr:hypothetical protein Q1695_014125 [Nippostrongylus brasiliensis]